jgi:hypothetical protein
VNCDLLLTLMASSLYRLLAARVGHGYETAKSRHLFRDFVDATAAVTVTDTEIQVRFQQRAAVARPRLRQHRGHQPLVGGLAVGVGGEADRQATGQVEGHGHLGRRPVARHVPQGLAAAGPGLDPLAVQGQYGEVPQAVGPGGAGRRAGVAQSVGGLREQALAEGPGGAGQLAVPGLEGGGPGAVRAGAGAALGAGAGVLPQGAGDQVDEEGGRDDGLGGGAAMALEGAGAEVLFGLRVAWH